MFDKWLKLPAHYYLRITALVILTVGICLHNTLMSIGAIWIMANWLIEGDFRFYWKKLKRTPTVWMLLGILFFGLLSILWSDNANYGLWDIFRKLPFFAIPLALGLGKPVEKKILYFLLYLFIGMLLLTSGINFYRYHYVLDNPADIRQMSFFISPIRFSIVVVLGIFTCIYLIIKKKGPMLLWLLVIPWLAYYTLVAQMLNGYLLMFVLAFYTTVYLVKKNGSYTWKWVIGGTFFFGVIFAIYKTDQLMDTFEVESELTLEELEVFTPSGNQYFHDLTNPAQENGNLVWVYVQQEEVKTQWELRSNFPYDSLDNAGQPMFGTILRYMTSKGVRKDSAGVWELTDEEVRKIENGMTTVNTGYKAKLHEILYQWLWYKEGGDPNGHSLLQRAEHMRVAWSLVKKNPILGVGVGDVPDAFNQEYIDSGSKLHEDYWHRSHNQFLTMWISHGIIGLITLIGMLFIPLFTRKERDYFHWAVFLALFVSLFFQDMLETQAGVTIFGLFYGLTVYKQDEDDNLQEIGEKAWRRRFKIGDQSLSSDNKDSSEEE